MLRIILTTPLLFASLTLAHGGGGGVAHQKPLEVSPDADWMTRHMAEEHHISTFDASSFFTLHDYDGSNTWDADEIRKTYGLSMPSDSPYHTPISSQRALEITNEVLNLMDTDKDGVIQRAEWLTWTTTTGGGMPDFGLGPGHHGDDEYEYEIHHWEKYHDENTREEDLTHPEDIAHFKHHDELEDEEERQAQLDRLRIVDHNIPQMFRRS